MGVEAATSCANCQRLQARLDALSATVAQPQATIARLEGQRASAHKDSSTSSKPPSSDLVKPPKPQPAQGQDQREIGGQPGHPKHERALFPPEQVNGGFHDHYLELCPACGHGLQGADGAPRVVQQLDLREVPLLIEEHRGHPALFQIWAVIATCAQQGRRVFDYLEAAVEASFHGSPTPACRAATPRRLSCRRTG
jgi:transposase